jgi:hypothetical protein
VTDPANDADGVILSWSKERAELNWMRSNFPALMFQNNGLGGDEGCFNLQPLASASSHFCWMYAATRATPKTYIGFQTEGDNRLKPYTINDAVDRAVAMGACWVEHNQFGDPTRAKSERTKLQVNCP